MPRRSPPGNRLALEDALEPFEVAGVHAAAERIGVPSDRWHRVGHLAHGLEVVAQLRLADRLQAEGMTQERALLAAASRLGLNPETLKSRSRRMVQTAYRGDGA